MIGWNPHGRWIDDPSFHRPFRLKTYQKIAYEDVQVIGFVLPSLNPKNEDDRVRIALGLTSDDPLQEVDEDTLRTYHHYLAAHLTFPFEAKWEPEYGPSPTIKITGLSDAEGEPGSDEMYGLFCEARAEGRLIEVPLAECEAKKGSPTRQLLNDYAYWFWNNR